MTEAQQKLAREVCKLRDVGRDLTEVVLPAIDVSKQTDNNPLDIVTTITMGAIAERLREQCAVVVLLLEEERFGRGV